MASLLLDVQSPSSFSLLDITHGFPSSLISSLLDITHGFPSSLMSKVSPSSFLFLISVSWLPLPSDVKYLLVPLFLISLMASLLLKMSKIPLFFLIGFLLDVKYLLVPLFLISLHGFSSLMSNTLVSSLLDILMASLLLDVKYLLFSLLDILPLLDVHHLLVPLFLIYPLGFPSSLMSNTFLLVSWLPLLLDITMASLLLDVKYL
ncbi:unnamed protein product [Acanthosepion pharaonis]|uniref:Uncharacterized protein n=1 Tax=Acanthosepion pharaonis TaxID=158019 RepID=A0A812C797_ACAPH|nr:unnamed protein product [Sepia pharaonis]